MNQRWYSEFFHEDSTFYDHQVPETQTGITEKHHHISSMNNVFLLTNAELTLQPIGFDPPFDDENNSMKPFISWKSSNQVLDCTQIYVKVLYIILIA